MLRRALPLLAASVLAACPDTAEVARCTVTTNCDTGFVCGPDGLCVEDVRPPLLTGGEGEGEGEGEIAEGEGEIAEGEGETAEGEGETAEGEGETAEGEGETAEGEGETAEGEGDTGGDVGDLDSPKRVTIPFNETTDLGLDKERDCYEFTVPFGTWVFSTNGADTGTCANEDDTVIELFDDFERSIQVEDDIDGGGHCSNLEIELDAGTYFLCVEAFDADDAFTTTVTGHEIDDVPPPVDGPVNTSACVQDRGGITALGATSGVLARSDARVPGVGDQAGDPALFFTDVYHLRRADLGSGFVGVRVTGSFDPVIAIYDADIGCADGPDEFNDDIFEDVPGGEAFLFIDLSSYTTPIVAVSSFASGATGTYTLSIE